MKTRDGKSDLTGLPRSVAVIGAGTMGLGIAEYFALAGIKVILLDANPNMSRLALDKLALRVKSHVEAGLLDAAAWESVADVRIAEDIAGAVADVDLVVEAVPERIEIKRDVLAACDAHAPAHTIIASNTSSFPIDELAAFVASKARFLGMHWFNPPEWTPGVEVIPSAHTDPAIIERTRAFLLAIGKRPATVNSGPGFVANRIQFALFREAVACVAEGLATPQEVDEVVRSSFGFRLPFYGPFQIADMAGLDVYASIYDVLAQCLGAGWQAPDMLREIVAEGRLGSKTLTGFYDYDEKQRDEMLLQRDRRYAALNELLNQMRSQISERKGSKSD